MSATNNPKFFENLQDEILKSFYSEVEKITEKIGWILVREVKDVLRKNDKLATGDAMKSTDYKVYKLTKAYMIKCFLGVNYAQFIYDDTKPHWPPINKIAKWVRTKQLSGRYSIKTRKRLGNKMTQYDEDRQIAFLIARKIARKGTKGIKFFNIALQQAEPRIISELKNIDNIKFV